MYNKSVSLLSYKSKSIISYRSFHEQNLKVHHNREKKKKQDWRRGKSYEIWESESYHVILIKHLTLCFQLELMIIYASIISFHAFHSTVSFLIVSQEDVP